MKRILVAITFGLIVALSVTSAQAVTLGFNPVNQTVNVGTSFLVDLNISGLGPGGSPSLGTFDLDVTFDQTILSFNNATYGDPILGDQLDLFGLGFPIKFTTLGVGSVNLFELSFNTVSELELFQASSFTLATLTFDALSVGTSPLGLSVNALGDAFGFALSPTVSGGSVKVRGSVSAVPEPATLLLFGLGLAGLVGIRRRFKI